MENEIEKLAFKYSDEIYEIGSYGWKAAKYAFIEGYKAALSNPADFESKFIEKLIEEFPSHGIDTSMWEYSHGDCCDDAVEFLARCINSENEAALSKGNGDVSWDAAIKRYDEITPTFLQNIGSFTKFLLKFYTLKAKTTT